MSVCGPRHFYDSPPFSPVRWRMQYFPPFFSFLFLSNRCVCVCLHLRPAIPTPFPMKGTLHMPLNTRTYTNMRRRRNICMGHVERRIPLFVDRYCTGNCYVGDYGAQTAISHIKAIKNKNIPISPIFSSVIPRSMSLFRKGRWERKEQQANCLRATKYGK